MTENKQQWELDLATAAKADEANLRSLVSMLTPSEGRLSSWQAERLRAAAWHALSAEGEDLDVIAQADWLERYASAVSLYKMESLRRLKLDVEALAREIDVNGERYMFNFGGEDWVVFHPNGWGG